MSTRSQDVVRAAARLGYEVKAGSSHYKIRRGTDQQVIVPFSGSDRSRNVRNLASQLRRLGYGDLAEIMDRRPTRRHERYRENRHRTESYPQDRDDTRQAGVDTPQQKGRGV